MFRVYSILIGYFLGCIQTAYILGKIVNNIDIRNYGSGNAGTTNVIRVMGWKSGVITFIGDLLKAILAVLLTRSVFGTTEDSLMVGLFAGIGVILGHNWPFYLKFKGGKGIAATIGTMLAVDIKIGLICVVILVVTLLITRYVSLGALLLTASIPILFAIFHHGHPFFIEIILMSLFFTVSAFYKHKSNIKRLLSGTESKLGQRSNKKVE